MALNANGYRTLTNRPGHHQTAIQTLPQSIGLPEPMVRIRLPPPMAGGALIDERDA